MSPSRAGFNFHSGSRRLDLPDSLTPISAVTSSVSTQPLSATDRKFVTLYLSSRIVVRPPNLPSLIDL